MRVLLETTGLATGGEAFGRDDSGRVVFVAGALAGEQVVVEILEEKKRFARGRVIEVVAASPERIAPTCAEVANGCGGCDLAHSTLGAQRDAKVSMIRDAATRIGRLDAIPSVNVVELATVGFRTTLRAGVAGGRAGLRRRGSNDLVEVAACEVAHPLVEELLVEGRFGDASEVMIRVGSRTGERMVLTDGDPSTVSVPDDVSVVSRDDLLVGANDGRQDPGGVIHEMVAGSRFRISPRSFFQTRPDGAEALVEAVRRGIDTAGGSSPRRLVDLCCGVGLFAATVEADRVVAVESNRSSVADARVNLAGLGQRAKLVRSTFERWRPDPADVVVADPSRTGLGAIGVSKVSATGAEVVVLVSCDVAAMGRDVGLFADQGYALVSVEMIDLFPNTSHAEVVSTLVPVAGAPR